MEKKQIQKKMKRMILEGFILCAVIFGVYIFQIMQPYMGMEAVTNGRLDALGLDEYDKLMIVAHPDDELIWGGGHLIEDDYFVVCITRGNDSVRKGEFEQVVSSTGDKGLILSYPDKIANKRSKWLFFHGKIKKDIETVIAYKDWEEIVTHNQEGEYGHQHHIMTHDIVVTACDEVGTDAEQMYFGDYYKKKDVPNDLQQIDDETLGQKEEIAKIYKSQSKTVKKLKHMFPYENWEER